MTLTAALSKQLIADALHFTNKADKMAYYTETKQFISTGETAVTINLNGGTASISILVGTTYQEIESYDTNASVLVEGRGVKFRVNVSGGAEYEVN